MGSYRSPLEENVRKKNTSKFLKNSKNRKSQQQQIDEIFSSQNIHFFNLINQQVAHQIIMFHLFPLKSLEIKKAL